MDAAMDEQNLSSPLCQALTRLPAALRERKSSLPAKEASLKVKIKSKEHFKTESDLKEPAGKPAPAAFHFFLPCLTVYR